MKFPLLLLLPVLSASALETRWAATGTVTSVTGAGLTATVGAPVSVEFSYDSGATLYRPSNFSFSTKSYYWGPIQLSMEAVIGESNWKATLPVSSLPEAIPQSPLEAVYAVAQNDSRTDTLRVTTSIENGASFGSFPYTGAASDRSIVVELLDSPNPSLFLIPGQFPDDSVVPSSISSGTGEIKAGTGSIKFSIDPASVTVETGDPFKVAIEKTATGIKLRWPTVEGQLYLLNDSDDCTGWQFIEAFTGTGAEQVHEITDALTAHPGRRFYQVVVDD
ncbi:hypothetical protein [Luteolibacter sp. Populi]|uniref:hypothetical protein n=1 Tax=Luteolibacter sp. Populi TaxID=3230487 RepID=UPI0034677E74